MVAVREYSDLAPVICDGKSKRVINSGSRVKLRRFEAHWVKRSDCKLIVWDNWRNGLSIVNWIDVYARVENCLNSLNQIPRHSIIQELNRVENEIDGLLEREELYWKKRAKVHWLKEGDKNIAYFHVKANERRRENYIGGIYNANGESKGDEVEVGGVVVDYLSPYLPHRTRLRLMKLRRGPNIFISR
ncbi:conserved hypothetical protein [Ricinus communis]|uniref:Uncharacterized protein n=1 Tax=Ricinus communis TaxID=3988 RepID=B9SWR7_RICCO|nr:conserved hypothetical protein [Ricinus communis]